MIFKKESLDLIKIFYIMQKLLTTVFSNNNSEYINWDKEYQNGQWDYLKNLDELAHYSIIIGYYNYLKPRGSILDVGSGEGLLQKRILAYSYSKYVGIDGSLEAINRASPKTDNKTFFLKEDMHNYSTKKAFDVIVFNESLYYSDNPLKVIRKFENYLDKKGIFIVSMYKPNFPISIFVYLIWKKISKEYKLIDETIIKNKLGQKWICRVYTKF